MAAAAGTDVLDELAAAVDGHARRGHRRRRRRWPAPAVAAARHDGGGVRAAAAAAAHDLTVVVRGRGTALHWGAPPRGSTWS